MKEALPQEVSQKTGSVAICANGHVHLRFGQTTVILNLDQFRIFLQAGMEALSEFEGVLPHEEEFRAEWAH
ncbi:MAG: hypothetical protein U1F57_01440 [bacterium]